MALRSSISYGSLDLLDVRSEIGRLRFFLARRFQGEIEALPDFSPSLDFARVGVGTSPSKTSKRLAGVVILMPKRVSPCCSFVHGLVDHRSLSMIPSTLHAILERARHYLLPHCRCNICRGRSSESRCGWYLGLGA
jgi:hypothetical protein